MNLSEKLKRVKDKIKPLEDDIILVTVVIFVALIAFGLGRLSAVLEKKTPIKIEAQASLFASQNSQLTDAKGEQGTTSPSTSVVDGLLVASKTGAKYHFPWCSGALRIKEENKVWFKSREEAEKAGYTPASNCKGL